MSAAPDAHGIVIERPTKTHEASSQPSEAEQPTEDEARPSTEESRIEPKPADHSAERAEQRAEADLEAQVGMREAADRLSVLTYWQMWIGGAGLVLLLGTLWANADAALSARRALEGLERPHLFVTRYSIRYTPARILSEPPRPILSFGFYYSLQNHGRSACTITYIDVNFAQAKSLSDLRLPGDYYSAEAGNPELIVGPGVELDTMSAERDVPADTFDWPAFREGREAIFVTGEIRYTGVFGRAYRRRFCYRLLHGTQPEQHGGPKRNAEELFRPDTLIMPLWRRFVAPRMRNAGLLPPISAPH